MKTVVGLFDSFADARAVVQELESKGFTRDQISIVGRDGERTAASGTASSSDAGDVGKGAAAGAGTGAVVGGAAGLLAGLAGLTIPVIGPALGAGWLATAIAGAGVGAAAGGLVGALVNAGVPKEHAEYYSEGVKRGGTLVTVRAEDARAQIAADIMGRHNVVDIDTRVSQWRGGTTAATTDRPTTTTTSATTPRKPTTATTAGTAANREGEQKLDVVEEELRVGKRQVQGGGVRIYAHVTEKPVEEQVTLRQEHVEVERRPVNRPTTAADVNAQAFKDQTIEVTARREEPIVQKEARVVEEVVVRKDVDQKTETVRDTVRRRDVEVEKVNPDAAATGRRRGFEDYDADFRKTHTSQYASSTGFSYDQAQPLYRSSYEFANDPNYSNMEWDRVEPDLRRKWESQHPGSWERVKDVARSAWNRARQKA